MNNEAGDQTSPDVDCNLTAYVSQDIQGYSRIHYQVGPTNTDLVVSGNSLDFAPDVDGNRIAFTEVNPTGDGVAVYDALTQFRFDIPGSARSHPAIGGDLVAYEDRSFSYCNGVGHIVYAAPAADYDVYTFTFLLSISPSPADQINALIALVRSFNLSPALENSLVTKLQDALAAVNSGDTATACSSMASFINKVQTQSNKKITADQKSQLIDSANEIRTNLGCA